MIDNTKNITSTGEPVTPAPALAEATTSATTNTSTPDSSPVTAPATETPAAEATATAASETTNSTTLDEATHAAHRQRVDAQLKKITSISISSGETAPASGSETEATIPAAAPATTTAETPTPAPDTSATPATLKQPDTAADAPAAQDELITIQVEPMAVEAPGTIAAFLASYLANGYFKGEGKARYPDPALVDDAEAIGKALAGCGVTPTAFNRMVKTLKSFKKLPYEAQEGAMKKLLPLALKEKKPLLREVVEKNQAAVQTEEDYAACLEHFQDMAIFLAAAKAS